MTESEWLECSDPSSLLKFLSGKVSDRKLRLFVCACCRQAWHLLSETDRRAVELGERFAVGEEELKTVRTFIKAIDWTRPGAAKYAVYLSASRAVEPVMSNTEQSLAEAGASAAVKQALDAEGETAEEARQAGMRAYSKALVQLRRDVRSTQVQLVRDLFGNPFHGVSVNPAWQSNTVVALARATYDNRILPAGTFDGGRLAVLADALEDAGCTSVDVLNHLRQSGVHVWGCWAVNLLLE